MRERCFFKRWDHLDNRKKLDLRSTKKRVNSRKKKKKQKLKKKERKLERKTSNDDIAGNGRIMVYQCLYLPMLIYFKTSCDKTIRYL